MQHLYILGAGSSKDFGYPLGKELFSEASKLAEDTWEKCKSPNAQHLNKSFNNVKQCLKELIPYLPEECSKWPNFEELYTIIEIELRKPSESRNLNINDQLLHDMKKLIFHTFSQCHRHICFNNDGQKKYQFYQKYFESLINSNSSESPVFINFNYDILLDTALHDSEIKIDYCLEYYNFSGERIVPSNIKVIKPHGSLNLIECSNCSKTYYSTSSIIAQSDNNRANCPFCKSNMTYNEYLIAPSYLKDIKNSYLAQIIVEEIKSSNNITIIGYSFPDYDFDFKYLFYVSLLKSKYRNNIKFNVIDCGDLSEIKKRYNFLNYFSNDIIYKTNGFLEYIKNR